MPNFTHLMQFRVANLSVDAASVRNMGPSGSIAAAREFLKKIDLRNFADPTSFPESLDAGTLLLKSILPDGGRHWGSARKFMNLFLRDATYNYHLREAFGLHRVESELELPLDSHSARGLRDHAPDAQLPTWRSVIHLTPAESDKYQRVASVIAAGEEGAK